MEEHCRGIPEYARQVNGVDALEMTPKSPFDSDRANPVLISLEVKGVEVEVSGETILTLFDPLPRI